MKCPKCGFISFDDLSTCTKCSTDLSAVAKELQGTGAETEPEFFLSSAIKNTNLDFDDTFSSTQTLPPLESDVELDFDDTSNVSQGIPFSPDSSAHDIEIDSTGEVALELGEIMPIDLSQLDSTMEISALAAQGADTGTESLPDDATMAMGLEDLTSQNLTAMVDEPIDAPDLTAQLADLDEPGPSAEDLDETIVLSELELDSTDTNTDEALDENIVLPDLDQLDIDIDEGGEEAQEELSFDATAVTNLNDLEGIEDVNLDEPTEDNATPEPELNLNEIDLSDLVGHPVDHETEETPPEAAAEDDLADIDLDSTADALDLSTLDNDEEDASPENPIEEINDVDDDKLSKDAASLPDLDLDQLDFDGDAADQTGGQEPIVDLSSLIEEEGVQDEGDATIELDLLSDNPVPTPEADSSQDIPEVEVDMTPVDSDDAPPDLPE